MKTIYIKTINKPLLISIHNLNEGYYRGYQWSNKAYVKDSTLIGVWHIKYKDIDCNFT